MSDLDRLPCDVLVQPATLIKRGCRIETLLECIEMRRERSEKGPPLNDILSRRQADEILALRKEVEDAKAEMKRRDENETRNCINWGPCSLHDGRMTESAALATEASLPSD